MIFKCTLFRVSNYFLFCFIFPLQKRISFISTNNSANSITKLQTTVAIKSTFIIFEYLLCTQTCGCVLHCDFEAFPSDC